MPLQVLFTLLRTTPGLFASFGFPPGQRPVLGAFLLFNAIIGPIDEVECGSWGGVGWGGSAASSLHLAACIWH
jgi:hypothetical protein